MQKYSLLYKIPPTMERSLLTLLPSEKGIVCRVETENPEVRERLLSMGIVHGSEIEFKNKAPLGDPITIILKGYSLSLRKSEAEGIILQCPSS